MSLLVIWEIDSSSEDPLEAAVEAFMHMRRPETTAVAFKVIDEDDNVTEVDLQMRALDVVEMLKTQMQLAQGKDFYTEISPDEARKELPYFESMVTH